MSVSEPPPNLLYRLAAVAGALLAVFLVLGAHGHALAVWPRLASADTTWATRATLLLPAGVLLLAAVLNLFATPSLWRFERVGAWLALPANALAIAYLCYLLARGVPGHPVGIFLALATAHTMVLGALCLGLRWPLPSR